MRCSLMSCVMTAKVQRRMGNEEEEIKKNIIEVEK